MMRAVRRIPWCVVLFVAAMLCFAWSALALGQAGITEGMSLIGVLSLIVARTSLGGRCAWRR